ncbi:OmpA family protein [Variovorax humicola]|uniref:OmpA family protein n=1 Tax=Variovorax humicola TaxID=1769758 RepID=A0ABU8VY22_9BURK
MIRYLSTLALALAAAAALIAIPAKAEKVVVYREGQLVLPQDVADVLGNTRSIRLLDDAPKASAPAPAPAKPIVVAAASKASTSARPSAPVHAAPAPRVVRDDPSSEAPSALSLPVQFGFDSAEILPAARTQLDALAAGIKLLSPESIVTIEGHTDASGSAAYNLELSRVRARAVRDYLVQRHGIDAARLKTVGYGKDRPIEDSDPHAAINRRVQFRGS